MSPHKRRVLVVLLVIGALLALLVAGTFSAFSSTTVNSGNDFASGTVLLTDNDADSAMYAVTNRKPGDSITRCIAVTYSGSLAADVKLYTTSSIGSVGQYVSLTVEKGTATGAVFPNCGTFTSESTIYSGTLSGFASAKNSYALGVSAYPGVQTQWNQSDSLVYRFTLTLQDDNSANGGASPLSTGSHAFTWEARNQ